MGTNATFWGWETGHPLPGNSLRRLAGSFLGNQWSTRDAKIETIEIKIPAYGNRKVGALVADPCQVVELLSHKHITSRWSPSLRWLHTAVELGKDMVVNGYALPVLETDGLHWKAEWRFIEHSEVRARIKKLEDQMPPVLAASSEVQTQMILQNLVDATCRIALKNSGWKPAFPRSRKSSVTAFRRVMAGLYDPTGSVSGETVQHESSFLALCSDLGDTRARMEGLPPIACRSRLRPGDGDELWELEFETFSLEDPSLVIPWNDYWEETPLALQIGEKDSLQVVRSYITDIARRLAASVPGLDNLEEYAHTGKLQVGLEDVSLLLLDGLDLCETAGVQVLVPKELVRKEFKLTAEATPSERGGVSANLGTAMVDIDWNLVLGDDPLNKKDLQTLADAKGSLVRLKGQWVNIDANQAQLALGVLAKRQKQVNRFSPAELLRLTTKDFTSNAEEEALFDIPVTETTSSEGWISQLLEGLPDERLEEVGEPEYFCGELRPYQRRGLAWLQFLSKIGLGGCLADDMGLGKTPTTLAHILSRTGNKPSLVICPLSVVHNWESEAQKFTPTLNVSVAHGSNRPSGQALIEHASNSDIVITTYGTATRDISDLSEVDWDLVICDEAQFIKNHHTNAAAAVRRLFAQQKIALTGTPVENRLSELWAILDAMNPGMLGGISWFKEKFATPIETQRDPEALAGMRQLTDPFILRRTKDDRSLVPDLPEKIEQIAWSKLTHEQAGLYKAVLDDFLSEASEMDGMKRKGLILATLTKLKQICNHPAQFLADGSTVADRSGKLTRLDELLTGILEAGQQVLIFTQYRVMGELLVEHLTGALGEPPPFLHGGVSRANREKMITSFQNGTDVPVFLVSLKAGGTGLNLTAANRVIHFDRWWNPAVEDQATDRAWRIGQDQTVFVHKLVCQGTLEERIDQLLENKKELANRSVGTGDDWFTDMDTDQLREVLSLNLAEAVEE